MVNVINLGYIGLPTALIDGFPRRGSDWNEPQTREGEHAKER